MTFRCIRPIIRLPIRRGYTLLSGYTLLRSGGCGTTCSDWVREGVGNGIRERWTEAMSAVLSTLPSVIVSCMPCVSYRQSEHRAMSHEPFERCGVEDSNCSRLAALEVVAIFAEARRTARSLPQSTSRISLRISAHTTVHFSLARSRLWRSFRNLARDMSS